MPEVDFHMDPIADEVERGVNPCPGGRMLSAELAGGEHHGDSKRCRKKYAPSCHSLRSLSLKKSTIGLM